MLTPVPAPAAPVVAAAMPETPLPPVGPFRIDMAVEEAPVDTASLVPSPGSPLPETPTSWEKIANELREDPQVARADPPDLPSRMSRATPAMERSQKMTRRTVQQLQATQKEACSPRAWR